MVQDTLELADDRLFIDKIKHTFTAADGNLLTKAYIFSRERVCGLDSTPIQAADLLIDQGAGALTITCALLTPFRWQDRVDLDETQKHFDWMVAAEPKDLNPPSILRSDTRQYCREDIHVLLASMGSVFRKPFLFIALRLLALENATDSLNVTNVKVPKGAIVKVNGKTADLDRPLRNGDSIEILTGETSLGRQIVDIAGQHTLSGSGTRYPLNALSDSREPSENALSRTQ